MLTHLLIENYALIHKLDTSFHEGLTVISGETGAGKSILLGALSLILGERADSKVLGDPSRKCIIEGSFSLGDVNLQDLFRHYDLDYEEVNLFRREISPRGKSRAFINDSPVNLQTMRHLAGRLIDIHSQHESLLLATSSFQFDVLDAYAGQLDKVQDYRKQYNQWLELQKMREDARLAARNALAEMDYHQFQLDELEKVTLDEVKHREMEEQAMLMRNAEDIRNKLSKAVYLLEDADLSLLEQLHGILTEISTLSAYGAAFEDLAGRMDSVLIELKDIARGLQDGKDQAAQHDPEAAAEIESRLNEVNRLMMKHHAASVEELVSTREDYRSKLQSGVNLEEEAERLDEAVRTTEASLRATALELSAHRKKVIPSFEQEILGMLKKLAMPNARFALDLQQKEDPGIHGIDRLRFLFNANPGGQMAEISRLASGGELSRVMLSIKAMVSQKQLLPTIIFDEIDTGISGETSTHMGQILHQMAARMQVVAITHLPQIAARGDAHLQVYKEVTDGKTYTRIKNLDQEGRIRALATMLGGKNPTKAMLETAKELIFSQ